MFRQMLGMVTVVGTLWLPSPSMAEPTRTLHVANNALDSATCGAKANPCRSISRAIAHARDGDRILVHPGRYGDLNADGDFSDPGDEAAEVQTGCRCMILINKRLKVESTGGAQVTVLAAAGAVLDVVNITASNVSFGDYGKGFTLTGAGKVTDDDGIGLDVLGGRDVRVIGNIAQGNRDAGFAIRGDNHTVRDNVSTGNGMGFSLGSDTEGHTVKENLATNNGNDEVFGHGFAVGGQKGTYEGNKAIGNRGIGFYLVLFSGTSDFEFEDNEAIGNRGAGMWVRFGAQLKVRSSNFFGNLGESVGGSFPAAPNCGLVNDMGGPIDAARNYWGAATGPGPDPADDAGPGSICDVNGTTVVVPFDSTPNSLLESLEERQTPVAE
ncbi:right-handed parallel beta-helix repeat-containing protein [Myxococcus sp. CA051A]|uniref:right-handed parallel beta-helix repeat-containing protein n=1 Tax=unclassified Myxococcus TaxID=2648731 RepID=UPI00157B88B1|nr:MULTISPECIES: right-handed parallel beta-helix repeat-containing protein [unclassified Myxococcus]NTX16619.1 right-handed parallel beta-helix repeat-containing protein [Myxococcus sp. CA056]NTX67556.1 right-handed parallel beta-helix repeat-containing protein [Myxococcus sp. CA051A]